MTVAVDRRASTLAGGHESSPNTKRYKSVEIPGLAGPSQGSAEALATSGTIPTAMSISWDSRGIKVTPPEVTFEDVRAGLLFVLTFSVQNTCGETRRIRVIPPQTPVFSLNYEPVGGLAPGLDVRAEVEFQLPEGDEADDLGNPFAPGEVQEYADKFVVISGKDKVEVPLLARRPIPAVVHDHLVEYGTVSDEKKAYRTVSLVNTGSRKASFFVTWDKALPLIFTPSEGVLDEGRGYRDAEGSTANSEQPWKGSAVQLEVAFDATKWSTTEPFRTLATLTVPGQQDSVIDLSATVCTQKLKLLHAGTSPVSELTVAEFGTLHYGCRGEIKAVLFNDGPETAPFMVSIDMEGNRGVRAGSAAGTDKKGGKEQLPFEVEPRDGTIALYGRQEVTIRFLPVLPSRVTGFKGPEGEQEPLPSAFRGKVMFENAEKKGDAVFLPVSGKGVRPTVMVTQRVVRFGGCPCYERRDVVVGIKNTGELPVRFNLSKAPNFSCTPSRGLLQPLQSQNTVVTFCPQQLGHFRGVLELSLGGNALVIPIRVVGEASTVGTKQPRPGGIDKLPADFKPKFNFVLSESASGLRRAAEGKEAWRRPKPFETIDLLSTNSWDSTTHTVGSVGGVDVAFNKLTFSMQDLARREQDRRDSDAWLTVQRLKRAGAAKDKEAARMANAQGKDWRDPEGGVEMGMDRWAPHEEPVPKLPCALDEPLFLHAPLDGEGKGAGAADVKADINKLITRKFKQSPATQAEARDCAAVVGREHLAKVAIMRSLISKAQ